MATFTERLESAVDFLIILMQINAPKKTGNLALNAIRKAWDPVTGYPMIVIGGEPAPYAIYTNEPWVAEKWKGTINPNMYWVQKTIEQARPQLILILSGEVTIEEVQEWQGIQSQVLDQQFSDLASSNMAPTEGGY